MATFVAKFWGSIGNTAREPVAYSSLCHAQPTGYFFLCEPLFTQVEELLIAI
jgi:hypothetical protein